MTDVPDDDVIEVDSIDDVLDRLKIREIVDLEEALGVGIDIAFTAGQPRGRGLQAIAWILRRRDHPEFTFEDAGELIVRFTDGEAPDRPTNAAGV